jgi:hypothetical protein
MRKCVGNIPDKDDLHIIAPCPVYERTHPADNEIGVVRPLRSGEQGALHVYDDQRGLKGALRGHAWLRGSAAGVLFRPRPLR